MLRFRRMRSLQKFVNVQASVYNHFNVERSLSSRPVFKMNRAAALAEWRALGAAIGKATLPYQIRVRIRLTAHSQLLHTRAQLTEAANPPAYRARGRR